jgi:hypothetical protein
MRLKEKQAYNLAIRHAHPSVRQEEMNSLAARFFGYVSSPFHQTLIPLI